VVSGCVNLIDGENNIKKVRLEIRRSRKRRERKMKELMD